MIHEYVYTGEFIKSMQATIDRLRAELEAERATTERLRAALRDIHRHVRHDQSEAVPDEFLVVD